MDLIADRGRRVTIEELNTTRLLSHARKQAHQRNLDDMVIVDVDAHHYEGENYDEFLPYMESDVLRQLATSGRMKGMARANVIPSQVGYQDMGGRVTRYPLRSTEKTEGGSLRDVQLGHRWMDAMSVDYSCLFPTGMLSIGLHPQKEVEADLCWAYNRWLTEKVLPEGDNRFYSMLCLPFSDPEQALRHVETFGDRKHVGLRQRLYEALPGHGGARSCAVVPFRSELGRGYFPKLQPLPIGACARLHLVQCGALHELGDQRHGRTLPEAAGDLD
jgi:hypothetical protein